MKVIASGAIFYSINTHRVMMQLRSKKSSYPLTWSLWGGRQEPGERLIDTLNRELVEEMGQVPEILKTYPLHKYSSRDSEFEYHSFCCVVKDEFMPELNQESAGYAWFEPGAWPKPLHSGARGFLLSKTFSNKLKSIISHTEKYYDC